MKKNIVFIPNVDLGDGRSSNYKYSIDSWKAWGAKNDIRVIEWKDPITDPTYMKITLQRYWVHDILQHNEIDYDQVLIVDADTIIHPTCPNFFHLTKGKFSVVLNNGCYEWVTRSIDNWCEALFKDQGKIDPWEYFNGGFQITSKEHIPFYNFVKDFYEKNISTIKELSEKIKAGTDQTIVNYLANKFDIEINYLPEAFNLQDLFRKNLLHIPGHSWFKDELLFTKAGYIYHFNAIPQNPRHVNYWLERTYKELYSNNSLPEYSPISLEYFLNMEVAKGGGGKEVLNLNGELKTVRQIVDYWKKQDKDPELNPKNWQYYNCMKAGFRKNVADHHDIGWDKMTMEYYESLDKMTDKEIEKFLQTTPSEFDNGFIKHSYHRAYAMIGRLIRGEKYIPFYMKTELIYNTPTKLDGIHRVKPLTSKLNLLKELLDTGIDTKDFCLTQSSILTLMGIRSNDDLDIIISSDARNKNYTFPNGIEVFPQNYDKFKYFGANNDDDILNNYCITIDGIKFLEPRFYFARKNITESERDKNDWKLIKEFFENKSHLGFPFNFDFYKWGLNYTDRVQVSDLELSNLPLIKDKYNRVVDGINHGRAVYYDKENNLFIKLLNPSYCRIDKLRLGIESGLFNGLTPALKTLIYDKDLLVGYIMEGGKVIEDNDSSFEKIPPYFLETVIKNCKKRSLIYYDLVPQNIIKLNNGEYSLIDLESVYGFDEIDKMKKENATFKPNNLLELILKN